MNESCLCQIISIVSINGCLMWFLLVFGRFSIPISEQALHSDGDDNFTFYLFQTNSNVQCICQMIIVNTRKIQLHFPTSTSLQLRKDCVFAFKLLNTFSKLFFISNLDESLLFITHTPPNKKQPVHSLRFSFLFSFWCLSSLKTTNFLSKIMNFKTFSTQ